METEEGSKWDEFSTTYCAIIGWLITRDWSNRYYQDTIVVVDKKYQCPKLKKYLTNTQFTDGYGMTNDKNQLGKKVKKNLVEKIKLDIYMHMSILKGEIKCQKKMK